MMMECCGLRTDGIRCGRMCFCVWWNSHGWMECSGMEVCVVVVVGVCRLSLRVGVKGIKKCSLPGSNWRPSDYETDALPTEPKERHNSNPTHTFTQLCAAHAHTTHQHTPTKTQTYNTAHHTRDKINKTHFFTPQSTTETDLSNSHKTIQQTITPFINEIMPTPPPHRTATSTLHPHLRTHTVTPTMLTSNPDTVPSIHQPIAQSSRFPRPTSRIT